ncbi:MAG TPA: EFR1 family ferrodoxin [Bacillota bacterium]|nr:EFR1 family ferrodoxin [Bacillota bacterium]
MKTVICYLSGTGNSLAVAKGLANGLDGEVELLSVTGRNRSTQVRVSTDRLGLVFPVQFLSVPEVVRNFVRSMDCQAQPYIFAVATCNAVPGHTLYTMKRLLKQRGLLMAVGFTVDMPGNIMMNPETVQNERLQASKTKISQIVQAICEGRSGVIQGSNAWKWYIEGRLMGTMTKLSLPTEKRFRVNDNCKKCGLCRKVCPTMNIRIDPQKGPVWGRKCAFCMACFHWCPEHAIVMNSDKIELQQYHHPEVRADEITR